MGQVIESRHRFKRQNERTAVAIMRDREMLEILISPHLPEGLRLPEKLKRMYEIPEDAQT